MPIYGLKFLTEAGQSMTDEFGLVTYPVNEWVTVPGDGTEVAMEDNLLADRTGGFVAQFECEEPTEADTINGVTCFRRVKRLEELDMEWVKTLSYELREEVAECGTDSHRDVLMNDPDNLIRSLVAQYGNDKHRDALLHDSNGFVRKVVAMFGNDTHRNALMNDPDPYVRRAVAVYGTDKQRDAQLAEGERSCTR